MWISFLLSSHPSGVSKGCSRAVEGACKLMVLCIFTSPQIAQGPVWSLASSGSTHFPINISVSLPRINLPCRDNGLISLSESPLRRLKVLLHIDNHSLPKQPGMRKGACSLFAHYRLEDCDTQNQITLLCNLQNHLWCYKNVSPSSWLHKSQFLLPSP